MHIYVLDRSLCLTHDRVCLALSFYNFSWLSFREFGARSLGRLSTRGLRNNRGNSRPSASSTSGPQFFVSWSEPDGFSDALLTALVILSCSLVKSARQLWTGLCVGHDGNWPKHIFMRLYGRRLWLMRDRRGDAGQMNTKLRCPAI